MKTLTLFLLLAVSSFAGTVNVTCANSTSDPTSVTNAISTAGAGGTVNISGTCNFSANHVNITSAINIVGIGGSGSPGAGTGGASINGASATSNSGYAFQIAADNVSITHLIFNNGIGPAALNGNIRVGFTFQYNTVEYTGTLGSAMALSAIMSYSHIDYNYWYNIGPAGMQSYTSATWPTSYGGGVGIPGSPSCEPPSGAGNCDAPWGLGIAIGAGIDNTTINYNTVDWVSQDWIHANMGWLGYDPIWPGTAGPSSISYNKIRHGHRYSLELQGTESYPNCGPSGGPTSCDFNKLWFTGMKIDGNVSYDPAPGTYYNTWSYSIVWGTGDGEELNNTALDLYAPVSGYGIMGEAFETGWHGATVQGNVATGVPVIVPGVKAGTYDSGFAVQVNNRPGTPAGHYNIQNNILCDVNQLPYPNLIEPPGTTYLVGYTYQYNWDTGYGVPQNSVTCPGNPTIANPSNVAISFISTSSSGANVTWNWGVVSNLSIINVQYYVDGSATAVNLQELQDLNPAFATTRQWFYHETLNTSTLSPGSHTMKAVATDVLGATQSNTQSFIVGGGGPLVVTCAAPCSAGPGQSVTLNASQSVSWAMASGSIGTVSPSSGMSTTYTAPAVAGMAEANNSVGGCMVLPNDAVYNTRIDALPVNANSTNWVAALVFGTANYSLGFAWMTGINVIDNNTPTVSNPLYLYTSSYNGTPIQIPVNINRKRENGATTNVSGVDHHIINVNHTTCQFSETYHDQLPVAGISLGQIPGAPCVHAIPDVYTGCTAVSALQYPSTNYTLATNGATAAGGQPLAPMMLRASELLSGSIKHALRFEVNTGSCGPGALWPASSGGGNCNVSNAPPMGARFRMKSSATCPSGSSLATTICTALKQYGIILDDIGGGNPYVTVDPDNYYDPTTRVFWDQTGGFGVPMTDFEAVDESSLMVSTTSLAVKPNNGYVTPTNSALVSVNAGAVLQPIALTPVTVGVSEPYVTMISGQTFTPTAWVNGTSTTTVNWTVTGGRECHFWCVHTP